MFTLLQQTPGSGSPTQIPASRIHDISGYEIFGHGATGEAHALAHQMLDSGQLRLGHRLLGQWLADRSGYGSDWVHLHFHMAIFELALGEWHQAYARFRKEVLPAAATSTDALTDAPALLWRIAITAPKPVVLPWQPLRQAALAGMQRADKPFVQIHHLLALAGAGDTASIVGWLRAGREVPSARQDRIVERVALACCALAARAYRQASDLLQGILPDIPLIGGSHAQNQLFDQLSTWSAHQNPPLESVFLDAA
jgi:hypothetical protein